MPIAVDNLPDDIAELKAMVLAQQSKSAEQARQLENLRVKLNVAIEALRIERQRLYGTKSEKSLRGGPQSLDSPRMT